MSTVAIVGVPGLAQATRRTQRPALSPSVDQNQTGPSLGLALEKLFSPYGGISAALPARGGTVYVKPNAVHFTPHCHTDPAVLDALLAYLSDHGYRRLAVMESSTNGNFTRLVFKVTGYESICRRYGAKPVYLDEGPTVEVGLRDGTRARISRQLHEEVVSRRDNVYIGLPKLKTHPMTTVTLGVKNQQAFPVDADRMDRHSHETLHARLAALYNLVRPDFCIVEGLHAIAHGHFPPVAHLDECLVPMDLLIGGPDTLSVDVVCARIMGYSLDEIEHLRLCAVQGLGESNLDHIEVVGPPPDSFSRRLPHAILGRFHPDVHWVLGRDRACVEGCRGNSECIQEMLASDHGGKGGWTLVCGSGFVESDLDRLVGDLLVVGPCACEEALPRLRELYPDRKVFTVPSHNDLMANTRYQARLMEITPVKMVPLNPLVSAWTLLQARLRGLTARVPPLLG